MALFLTICGLFASLFGNAKPFVHFFEVRRNVSQIPVYQDSSKQSQVLYSLKPGQLVRADLEPQQIVAKMRSEVENKTIWIPLHSGQGWINYDWRQFIQIATRDGPLSIQSIFNEKKDVATLFRDGGHLSWRKCTSSPEICIAFPSRKAKLRVVETRFFKTGMIPLLFYKIDFEYESHSDPISGSGWAWAGFFKRQLIPPERIEFLSSLKKVDQITSSDELPIDVKEILEKRKVFRKEEVEVLLQKQQKDTVKKVSIFGAGEKKGFNRWSSQNRTSAPPSRDPAAATSSYVKEQVQQAFNFGIDFHMVSDIQHYTLTGGDYQGSYSQQSMRLGLGGIMSIFLDFEIMGTLFFTMGLNQSDPDVANIALGEVEQMLLLTTPIMIGDAPLKMGFTGSFSLYTSNPFNTGYRSLMAGKATYVIDAPRYFHHFTFGPVINSTASSLSNFELMTRFGYRLQPEKPFQSWSVMAEFKHVNYVTDDKLKDAKQSVFSLGLHRGF